MIRHATCVLPRPVAGCGGLHLVCADPDLAHRYLRAIDQNGSLAGFVLAVSALEAQRNSVRFVPSVTLLDESAVGQGDAVKDCAERLGQSAPVIVVASPGRQSELDACVGSGRFDFVPRCGEFVPIAAGLVERRLRAAMPAAESPARPAPVSPDEFGELLRHEVNNPLTGILGNAVLLLARREQLPPTAVERLETIAELAVRLRETVRRLSDGWHEETPSASESR